MTKDEIIGNYPVVLTQDIAWGDMDAFGHVNNVVYFRYFENARLAYFEKSGILAHLETAQVGPILAATQCSFRAPLAYPGRIQIATSIQDIREKRFTMTYSVYSDGLGTIAADGEGVIVYYDYRRKKSCRIPTAIKTAILEMQAPFA